MGRGWSGVALAVLAVLILVPTLFGFYTEYLWFADLGYSNVFIISLLYQVVTGVVAFLLALTILSGVYYWTTSLLQDVKHVQVPFAKTIIVGVSALLGLSMTGAWQTVLQYVNQVGFGVVDPVFANDVAFYTFALPFYQVVTWYVFVLVLISLGGSLVLYASYLGVEEHDVVQSRTGEPISGKQFNFARYLRKVREHAFTQVSILFGIAFLLYAVRTWLNRYAFLTDASGAVFGVGYTQASVTLPVVTVTAVIALVGSVASFVNAYVQRRHVITAVLAVLVVVGVGGNIAAGAVQSFIVEPDEFNKERPYLEREINATNNAFDLDGVRETDFSVSNVTADNPLGNHETTVDNIRLWDWRPLLTTYNELQIFRSYYTFSDIDVDRYRINGELRQVMLAPRAVDYGNIPTKTWVNDHLVYTHGHGVAMSPVRNVTSEGLPEFYIKDIPPQSKQFTIDTPALYYGENSNAYSIVDTKTKEFDYPGGNENVYTNYDGEGGVPVDSLFDRLAYAVRFGASQIFFSGSITSDSQIQYHKNVKERVKAVAPFLRLDKDPYTVVHDGRLYWIVDAYTTTDKYPYSRPHRFKGDMVNYARNSVKVVVDAYNGSMQFYTADQEPIIETWGNAFPKLLKPLEDMPDGLKRHVRYPEDLFTLQGKVYATYHMRDPKVFYNKEDVWRVPQETLRGRQSQMQPYYIIMQLPGEERSEFVQIMPYVPRGKENMIGWLAARSDTPNYGEIVAYHLSKQELSYGPMQVEARISQDADISKQITLWSQSGSNVFRGNLLAIPLDNSFLYIEPLFLKSTEGGSLPQLKRVIVAHRDKLTMQPTLDEALNVVFGNKTERRTTEGQTRVGDEQRRPRPDQLDKAQALYEEARSALRTGNLTLYHDKIRALGAALQE